MKKIIFFAFIIAFLSSYKTYGQHITTVTITAAKPGSKAADTSKVAKPVKADVKVQPPKSKPHAVKVQSLTDTGSAAVSHKADTTIKVKSAYSTSKVAIVYDCTNIASIKQMTVDKNTDGNYTFTLRDNNENPVSSFNLNSFDPASYVAHTKKALLALCADTTTASWQNASKLLCSQVTINDIYAASLVVASGDYVAGKLHIYKYVKTHFDPEKKKKPKKGASVDSTSKHNTTVLMPGSGDVEDKKDSITVKKGNIVTGPAVAKVDTDKTNKKTAGSGKPVPPKIKATTNSTKATPVTDKSKTTNKDTKTWNASSNAVSVGKVVKVNAKKDTTNGQPGSTLPGHITMHDLHLQFQDGFIENLIAHGKINGHDTLLTFKNYYPISFSTRRSFDQLKNKKIYEKTIFNDSLYVTVGDLISYDETLAIYSKDYFPANKVYDFDLTDSITDVNLLKEQTSKILAVEVYSDLTGVNSNSPNGLIQIEFSKQLNFLSYRVNLKTWNIGFINYYIPEFTLSKIENNGKYLVPNYFGSRPAPNSSQPNVFVTSTDLLLYQQYQVGGKLNLILFDVPEIKSQFYINFSTHYARTPIQDTLRTLVVTAPTTPPTITPPTKNTFTNETGNNIIQYGVNSFQLVPEVAFEIFPDPRFGVTVTQQFINYKSLSTQVRQIDATERYTNYLGTNPPDLTQYNFSKWIGSTELKAFFKPSDNNELFFRYRLSWDMNNSRNSFNQIQIGVKTYLTTTAKSSTASK
jgi:hypothetical protein